MKKDGLGCLFSIFTNKNDWKVRLMALTAKQKIFADEYLIDLNATRAYKVAYPKVNKREKIEEVLRQLYRERKI
ncbi:terminase small subunit [Lacrimispora amygdalina]|uniref:terminase small subunit n=1 Tax=Lacrimispora amygdalina TaxID=253257 RepID=UPI0029E31253|nr:terminase small subunit [Lacrimispora amygdalina]MDK2967992.1 phage terminase small subunit [Lacrimispora sp.]